jgi:DNA polymerase-3 subunit epsilon
VSAADQAKWQRTMPMLAFDIESTGVNVWDDRIVTACVVDLRHRPTPRHQLARQPRHRHPRRRRAVHGITTEHAAEHGQDPAEVLYEISGRLALWMGRRFPVVAMNASFDLSILEAENRRHGLPTLAERLAPKPIGPIIDPGVIDKKVDRYRKGGRKLVDLCAHYGVPLVAAHTAESDAASAVRLARAIIAAKPEAFRGMTIGGLHQAQQQWRHEQMNGLRAYFDKNGTEHDGCCGEWPVHVTCAPDVPQQPEVVQATRLGSERCTPGWASRLALHQRSYAQRPRKLWRLHRPRSVHGPERRRLLRGDLGRAGVPT